MKLSLRPMALAMLVCAVQSSCKKNDINSPKPSAKAQTELLGSPRIKYLLQNGGTDTLKFYYNAQGNPDSIIRKVTSTGYPSYRFNYDANGRLTTFIAFYNEFYFEYAQKFFYSIPSYPVQDSIYNFGFYYGNVLVPSSQSQFMTTNYFGDYLGRIKAIDRTIWIPGNPTTNHLDFNYNTAGNLTGYLTTDNNKNLKSLHRVWQLLSNDFSVNNGFIATSYNQQLPTAIPALNGGDPAGDFIHGIWLGGAQIIYE
ncbi:hypothetical protein CLV59_101263 [Chitinophaga dinghuensis]|uniref:Uncharacterized protein n=1 Tax=Chitinophaga dinghuensis TaxID=1539050 RepID=A0A327WCC7_9BACT|nr:hypothetical protein [Chitinophaga dinghuensis]RAJ87512.1 hypothetical protein CLV59_101263 [Chitinophaga dinghuensis]